MYSKILPLLAFAVLVSPAVGILKWDITDIQKESLQNFKGKDDNAPLKNLDVVGLECFMGDAALVIARVTDSEFYTYQLNMKKQLVEGSRFGASSSEKMKMAAEMYAKINLTQSLSPTDLAEHRSQLSRKGLSKAINLWEIEGNKGDEKALVVKKCVALVEFDDGSFAFAPYIYTKECTADGKVSSDTNEIIVLGYSQICESKSVAKRGLLAYLCNTASFGRIPLLPALYSGAETLAKFAFVAKAKEIVDLIQPGLTEGKFKVLRAWSIAKHTRCIAICSIAESDKIQYFFVVYESAKAGEQITLEWLHHIGSRGPSEFSAMMGLVDYLKPNYLSGEFVKIEPRKKPNSGVAELIFAADVAARKLLESTTHGKPDEIPTLNHSIEIANLVAKKWNNPSSAVCAALLLLPTLKDSTTVDEISELMESGVRDFMNHAIKIPEIKMEKSTAKAANKSFFKMLENQTSSWSFVQESVTQTTEPTLITLLQERRKKAYLKDNNHNNPPEFIIELKEAFWFENILYGTYALTELYAKDAKSHFRVVITNPYNKEAKVVVEELHHTSTPLDTPYLDEYLKTANTIKKVIDDIKDKNLTDGSNGDVAKLMTCLDYAAKKHYHVSQRRKDYQRTPFINHAIGVAQILAREGGITDMELVMAAILHDTLEYTSATAEELKTMFGKQVADIVVEVSEMVDDVKQDEVDRNQSPSAVLVRLADRIYNLRDFDRQCHPEYPEAKRRWHFTSTSNQLCRFEFNYNNNQKWNMKNGKSNPNFKAAFKRLLGVLESILISHHNSIKSPLDYINQVNGIAG